MANEFLLEAKSTGNYYALVFVVDGDDVQVFKPCDRRNPLPRDRLWSATRYDKALACSVGYYAGPKGVDQYGHTLPLEEARELARFLKKKLAWCNSVEFKKVERAT